MVVIAFVSSILASAFILSFFEVATNTGQLDYHYAPPFEA